MRTKDDFRFVVYYKNNGEEIVHVQERGLLWGWRNDVREEPYRLRQVRKFNSLEKAEGWLEGLLGDEVNEELTAYFYPSYQKFSKT